MRYISTRGDKNNTKGFREVLLAGMANDGGLFVPTALPKLDASDIRKMRSLPYNELAYQIIHPFVGGEIPDNILKTLIDDSYATFHHPAVAPLRLINENEWILELFHGPTLAFKDFALQLLGRLLNYVLQGDDEHALVLGATSGDTGSAAIEGCKNSENMDIYILHPHKRTSEIQRRQMTTVLNTNVHNIAIEGSFDDCQALVKQCFQDRFVFPELTHLIAVNSINWARIMAQIVYYFFAAVRVGAPEKEVVFSVPTGNFGDVYAGYIAKKMGLPVNRFIVATNKNDILHRFFQRNDYSRKQLYQTLSPSMDIMVSSNFERLLFDAQSNNPDVIEQQMSAFRQHGFINVDDGVWRQLKMLFSSHCSLDDDICTTIQHIYETSGYLIDPHTAAGVNALKHTELPDTSAKVMLATAHPAKFSEAITSANVRPPQLPSFLSDLLSRKERYDILPNSLEHLKEKINGLLASKR